MQAPARFKAHLHVLSFAFSFYPIVKICGCIHAKMLSICALIRFPRSENVAQKLMNEVRQRKGLHVQVRTHGFVFLEDVIESAVCPCRVP